MGLTMKYLILLAMIFFSTQAFAECNDTSFGGPNAKADEALHVKRCQQFIQWRKKSFENKTGDTLKHGAIVCHERQEFVRIYNNLLDGANMTQREVEGLGKCDVITWGTFAMFLSNPKENKVVQVVYHKEFGNNQISVGYTHWNYTQSYAKIASKRVK